MQCKTKGLIWLTILGYSLLLWGDQGSRSWKELVTYTIKREVQLIVSFSPGNGAAHSVSSFCLNDIPPQTCPQANLDSPSLKPFFPGDSQVCQVGNENHQSP